jgi:hypothetical protein
MNALIMVPCRKAQLLVKNAFQICKFVKMTLINDTGFDSNDGGSEVASPFMKENVYLENFQQHKMFQ